MKTGNLNFIVFCLFATFIHISCSKENSSVSYNTTLLTEKTWKFEMYGLDENNNDIIDESENDMQSCEADDIFTFNANGSGSLARGTLVCNAGESVVANFNWSFSNNETELAIFAAPEKISLLNDNTLEVYYMDQNLQGQAVKYIRRFKH